MLIMLEGEGTGPSVMMNNYSKSLLVQRVIFTKRASWPLPIDWSK